MCENWMFVQFISKEKQNGKCETVVAKQLYKEPCNQWFKMKEKKHVKQLYMVK